MTHRIGAKGQVVVPKAIRERLGLEPGDAVEFELRGDAVVLTGGNDRDRPSLGGRYAGSGMSARLLEDRAAEPR